MAGSKSLAISTHFEHLIDPRVERTQKHRLLDVVAIALCAVIAGADTWADIGRFAIARRVWLERVFDLQNGVPSAWTFMRVFWALDPKAVMEGAVSWLASLASVENGRLVNIDGKCQRGSRCPARGKEALHLVSAWAAEQHLVLGQQACEDKSNEITAIPKLLEVLHLQGAIVTIDAMGCQKEIAEKITEKKGDYVLAVKENQPTLYAEVKGFFDNLGDDEAKHHGVRHVEFEEDGHGRHETREYFVARVPASIASTGQWKGVRSIGMVFTQRTVNGKTSSEVRYYISSLPPKVNQFARAVRGHWGIENSLHWVLDVTFSEDASKIYKDNGPENFAALRRMALMILKRDTTIKDSLRGKRVLSGFNSDVLERVLVNILR